MNLIIDGVKDGGADEFAEKVSLGFEEEKILHERIGEPNSDDFVSPEFFARRILNGLQSKSVYLWNYSWISAILKLQQEFKRVNEFDYEFLCRRLLQNRGGVFVVLPETKDLYLNEFPKGENEEGYVSPEELSFDYELMLDYAQAWDYRLILHDFDWSMFRDEIVAARRATVFEELPFESTDYIGSSLPAITFVGDIQQEFPFALRPFHSKTAARYFEQFGKPAINDFGYCSIEGYLKIKGSKHEKNLLKRTIAVGGKAIHLLNKSPKVSTRMETGEISDVILFGAQVREIASNWRIYFK